MMRGLIWRQRFDATSASTIEEKKLQVKVAHVIGVSLGHTRSNPMNIMKSVGRRSSRAITISFNNIAKARD